MPKKFILNRGVAYPWLCDGNGHVATRYYTGWFDDASYHLMAMVGGHVAALKKDQLSWADVQSTIQYKQELRADELFIVESCFLKIGTKSVTSLHSLKNLDGAELATQEAVTVQFSLTERSAVPVKDNVREQIQALLNHD